MKYYSTQRPVMPGSYPKPQGNPVTEIVNYDERTFCEELGREVWGYIEYEKPLPRYDSDSYELTPVPTKTLHLRYLGRDSWNRYVYEDENGNLWKSACRTLPATTNLTENLTAP